MKILGLETSTAVCSVGLHHTGADDIEQSMRESHIHSEKLLVLLEDVLRTGGTSLAQLDAIAVSIGPGSFTGLRIGLSTAKGLSFALDKPIVAVPTFEAIAECARQRYPGFASIVVLMDARNNEWYVGSYRAEGEGVIVSGDVAVRTLDEVRNAAVSSRLLILTDNSAKVQPHLPAGATVVDALLCCRGDTVARLGLRKALRKEFADAAALEPMYLKDFVIRTTHAVS
jgi:tRNA threonylcarbamoyladenosine biosynthesis protein TsaB